MSENERRRLTSWKEIAAYLGREVRTVIRWEKERRLPVHRVPGGSGRSVFAYSDELERWARGEDLSRADPPASDVRRSVRTSLVATSAIVVTVAIASVAAWTMRGGELAAVAVSHDEVVGTTTTQRVLWRYRLPGPANGQQVLALVQDLDGDGRHDAVVSVDVGQPGGGGSGLLLALDHRGHLRWQHALPDRLTFAGAEFGPPWRPDTLGSYAIGEDRYVAWATHHHTWWPGLLAVFDGGGREVGKFVNAGWIRSVQATNDGRYLIAAGVSNSRDGAAFAVLDARNPAGSSPEDAGSPFACADCPEGRPIRYFVVRWSDVATMDSPDQRFGTVITYPTGTIELRAVQQGNADLLVELSAGLSVVKRATSDAFWEVHARLEREGRIAHARHGCPFRNGPVVEEWSAERGWLVSGSPW